MTGAVRVGFYFLLDEAPVCVLGFAQGNTEARVRHVNSSVVRLKIINEPPAGYHIRAKLFFLCSLLHSIDDALIPLVMMHLGKAFIDWAGDAGIRIVIAYRDVYVPFGSNDFKRIAAEHSVSKSTSERELVFNRFVVGYLGEAAVCGYSINKTAFNVIITLALAAFDDGKQVPRILLKLIQVCEYVPIIGILPGFGVKPRIHFVRPVSNIGVVNF